MFLVDCDAESDFIPKVKRKQQVPGEAHDLRIEPFAKAKPKEKSETYQLSVDISWQTPPESKFCRKNDYEFIVFFRCNSAFGRFSTGN